MCGDCSPFTADSLSEKQVLEPHLVVNEIVQREHRPCEGRQVNGQHHVIGLHCKGACQLLHTQIRQQVEDVLQRTTVHRKQHSVFGRVCRWRASCRGIALHRVLRLGNRMKMPWTQNNCRFREEDGVLDCLPISILALGTDAEDGLSMHVKSSAS